VAIGYQAGVTQQPSNSIVINATSSSLSSSTQNATFIKPIRNVADLPQSPPFYQLYYNINTGEIIVFTP